ncbi:MAG TPA: hypothetical protein EYP57_02545 [Thermodesulfobacteriaceae bacterium]|nr:hypothetical protein [Thermodesulfobacteriaceae bacterium]
MTNKTLDSSGELVTASLLVSVFSGFVVAYHYEVSAPFLSSVAVEAVLPFGAFWRSMHFWSSQLFFMLLLYHSWKNLARLPRISRRNSGRSHWLTVSLTIPTAILTLFTGYVLRFDGTGQAAGTIAEHLLVGIPGIGTGLNRFLMAVSEDGLNRVYLVHFILTALLFGLGVWYHTRRIILKKRIFFVAAACSACTAAVVRAPMDLPDENITLITGPWFFLGTQELLRHSPPLLAGIIFPFIPILTFAALPWISNRKVPFILLASWGLAYVLLSIACLIRSS